MVRKLLAHAAIVISGMYVVFFFIDRVNSAMGFINNRLTKALLLILCIISVLNAIILIAEDRRKERRGTAAAPRQTARDDYPYPTRPGYPSERYTVDSRTGYGNSRNVSSRSAYGSRPTGRF